MGIIRSHEYKIREIHLDIPEYFFLYVIVHPNDFGDLLTFPVVPSSGQTGTALYNV